MSEKKYDIGLMGLAVMGQNLVLNMVDHGFDVGRRPARRGYPDLVARGLRPAGSGLVSGEYLFELGAHPVGRKGRALVGAAHDDGDGGLAGRRVAFAERLDAGLVEGGVGGDEVGGDGNDVRDGVGAVEGGGQDAVKAGQTIAARIEHDAARHAKALRKRLDGIEGAAARA